MSKSIVNLLVVAALPGATTILPERLEDLGGLVTGLFFLNGEIDDLTFARERVEAHPDLITPEPRTLVAARKNVIAISLGGVVGFSRCREVCGGVDYAINEMGVEDFFQFHADELRAALEPLVARELTLNSDQIVFLNVPTLWAYDTEDGSELLGIADLDSIKTLAPCPALSASAT